MAIAYALSREVYLE